MMKTGTYLLLVIILLFTGIPGSKAQYGFYVPKDGKIFFTGAASIFSNVLNDGKFGIGRNSILEFSGKQWENNIQSLITDELNGGESASGKGGFVRFFSRDTIPQQLIGGYNAASRLGPAFSNLEVQSKGGLVLSGSSARITNELRFTDGLVYVNDNILSLGDGSPGRITGYDSLHYVVTDGRNSDGFLLRESITDLNGVVVFPIGSKLNAYTPAAIRSRTARPEHYYVNVSDGVKKDPVMGEIVEQGVKKTWRIGKQLHPEEDEVDVSLQHLNSDEGSSFSANRYNAYVSQYLQNGWNISYPQSIPRAGTLTTGPTLRGSGLNTSTFDESISRSSYFTKLTGIGDSSKVKTVLWFNGYRLDPNFVRVYWRTNPEVYNQYFVVQRRLSTETDFKNIDTVATQSVNGVSLRDLNYEIKDPNNYIGVTFYRLIMVDNLNRFTYSNIIAVAPMPGKFKLLLWPNPTPDRFFVGLNGEVSVKSIVIWDAIGQKLRVENVNGRSIIQFSGFIPGTYFVGFISTTNNLIETKKVVIIGY